MFILGLLLLSLILLTIGAVALSHGNVLGIGLIIVAFVPACFGSFLAGIISGHDDGGP